MWNQFTGFARDYFSDYRLRSITWFDGNIRGALEEVIARAPAGRAPAIVLNSDIPFVARYWILYATMAHRLDLLGRPVFLEGRRMDLQPMAPGTLILLASGDAASLAVERSGVGRVVAVITEPTGVASFSVVQR